MGLFDFIGSAVSGAVDWVGGAIGGAIDWIGGALGGGSSSLSGWAGTALGLGLDLFNYDNQRDAAKAAAEAQKKELDAIKKASGIQTERDLADLRKGQRRAMASVTAMAAASGVRSNWGTRPSSSRMFMPSMNRTSPGRWRMPSFGLRVSPSSRTTSARPGTSASKRRMSTSPATFCHGW